MVPGVFGVWCLLFGVGVWCLVFGPGDVGCWVFGVWCWVFGVWCLVFGVWCLVFGVWCLVFGAWCLWCGVGSGVWGGDTPAPSMRMELSPRARAYFSSRHEAGYSRVDMRLTIIQLTIWVRGTTPYTYPIQSARAHQNGEPNHPVEFEGFDPAKFRAWLEPFYLSKQP